MDKIAIIIAIVIVAVVIHFGFAYLIYWSVLKMGAPKYVAYICGMAYLITCGWFSNRN